MTQAEKLAASCDRSADLLALCDRQAATGAAPRVQVEWLLRGARFAATAEDRSAASTYLESALAAARADASLWERCVTLAQRLDGNTGDAKSHSYLAALITAHRRVAERSPTPVGVALMRRASRLVDDKLGDERMAFDLLRAGAALFPLDETMYDSLLERAEASGHLDALDAHLARGVEEALDPRTAACLLSRRARLLEGPLGRADDAANVYSKLLQLRPDDQQAASKLRESLRKARRFQDLLVVIHKQTLRAKQPDDKVELLKETAQVWELDLRNRWEAADAWAKVLELAPTDPEALRALSRLDRRAAPPSGPRAQGRVTPDLDRRQAPAQPSSDPNAPVLPPVAAVAAAPETRPLPPATLAAQEDSIELETLDESELEPVLETRRARRSTPPPPPPPPQALKSGTTPRRSSVVPPPPPPPPSKPKPS
jgi:tetratricopeptide (TPR) repeat protein